MSGKPPPPHIQRAARTLSDWMAQEGYEDWIINGCASSKTLIRLERQIEESALKRSGVITRLLDLAKYIAQK